MRAMDVMTRSLITVTVNVGVAEIAKLLLDRRISAVPVLDEQGALVGIVSEGDLMRRPDAGTGEPGSWWARLLASSEALAATYVKQHGRTAADVMTPDPITVTEETPLPEIARTLEQHGIKRVPVMRDGQVVGIVSRADLLRRLASMAGQPPAAAPASDAEIAQAIVSRIDQEDWTSKGTVAVEVTAGVARLSGMVRSGNEKAALRVLAAEVPGVVAVEDETRVHVFSAYI